MYKLSQIKLNIGSDKDALIKKVAKIIRASEDSIDLTTFKILRKSIDARDKKNIFYVYNVAFEFVDGADNIREVIEAKKHLERYGPVVFNPFVADSHGLQPLRENDSHGLHPLQDVSLRPVVVGFGPAGIFASYIFALNGIRPIIIERGKALSERQRDVEKFFKTMEFDENSNVCFGEGGAGAFSDGKLNTNNKDHDGVYRFILETFVKFGADEKILYESMPHIGTDKLVDVIKNIRNEIVRLGGEIHYNTRLSFENGLAVLATTNVDSQCIAPASVGSQCITIMRDTPVVLAIGNSARDTFRELIDNGFNLEAKPIAIGYRIAHKQQALFLYA